MNGTETPGVTIAEAPASNPEELAAAVPHVAATPPNSTHRKVAIPPLVEALPPLSQLCCPADPSQRLKILSALEVPYVIHVADSHLFGHCFFAKL